jgi:ribosomal protein S18 acetylase RimI-like enzyme
VSITIRQAEIEDIPVIYRLGLRCYKVQDKPYNYWTVREVASHIDGQRDFCFVATDADEVVGFALGDESYEVLEDTGHLEWVAIAPDHRRQGLAGRLIDAVVERMRERGRDAVVADISSDNAASRGMARKAGFTEGISVTFFTRRLR